MDTSTNTRRPFMNTGPAPRPAAATDPTAADLSAADATALDPAAADRTAAEVTAADVIVVGAGVSGCACAAVLAEGGATVMVLSSALDSVGLPGHGPDIRPGSGGWDEIEQTFGSLPAPLRLAWLNAACVPATGLPLLVVDRRAVSIETKRALEVIPGLMFRQGMATDLRVRKETKESTRDLVEVETAFGEVLAARAVVLAPGLGLGGVMTIGDGEVPGGRYGEVPATELHAALEALGVEFEVIDAAVAARYSGAEMGLPRSCRGPESAVTHLVPVRHLLDGNSDSCPQVRAAESRPRSGAPLDASAEDGALAATSCAADDHSAPVAGALGPVRERLAALFAEGSLLPGSHTWAPDLPPAPHWSPELAQDVCLAGSSGNGAASLAGQGAICLPDGAATGEFYLAADRPTLATGPSAAREAVMADGMMDLPGGCIPTRLPYRVRAFAVAALGKNGKLPGIDNVWVIGRSAGVGDYLASLRSGADAARAILRDMLGDTHEETRGVASTEGGAGDTVLKRGRVDDSLEGGARRLGDEP